MPKAKKPTSSPKIPSSDLDEFRVALSEGSDWEHEIEETDSNLIGPTDEAGEETEAASEDLEDESVTTEVTSSSSERLRSIPVMIEKGQPTPTTTPALPTKTAPKDDMHTLERKTGRHIPWGWIITIVAVLAAVTIGGFFFFNRAQRFSGDAVSLQFSGESSVAAGSEVELNIRYFNNEPTNLVRSELAIEYPEGFQVTETSVEPTNEAKNSFSLGTIASGRAGSMTIRGTLVGAVGTERVFNAVLTYRPANFSSDFQTRGSYTMKIASSILSLALEGPAKLSPGGQGTWTIKYQNTSDRKLDKIRIEAVYPEELDITKVDPAATDRSAVWDIENVEAEKEGKITITGKATGTIGDSLVLAVKIGLFSDGVLQLQNEQTLLVILVNSGVKTTVAVNGQADNPVIEVGDDIQYAIRIANQSENEVSDVTVTAKFTGSAANFQNLENAQNAKVAGDTLTWTKNEVPTLSLIKPGNDVVLRLTLGTQATLTVATDSDVNPAVTAAVVAKSPSFDSETTDGVKATVVTKIATTAQLLAEARYYDDTQQAIGSGPIPPVAGETTTYRIRWFLTNTTSDLTDLQVTTILPTHVFWTGKNVSRDAGDISFDSATRTVSWRLNKVPAGTGSRLPKLSAAFEISITPVSSDVGQVMVLTNASTAKATDGFSARPRESIQPSLTTELSTDPKGAGKGTVQSAG